MIWIELIKDHNAQSIELGSAREPYLCDILTGRMPPAQRLQLEDRPAQRGIALATFFRFIKTEEEDGTDHVSRPDTITTKPLRRPWSRSPELLDVSDLPSYKPTLYPIVEQEWQDDTR